MKKCPSHKIEILKTRKIISCDKLKFPWKQDSKGYFLIKIENKISKINRYISLFFR